MGLVQQVTNQPPPALPESIRRADLYAALRALGVDATKITAFSADMKSLTVTRLVTRDDGGLLVTDGVIAHITHTIPLT